MTNIHFLRLPSRALHILTQWRLASIEQLRATPEVELLRLPGFGRRSLHEVRNALAQWDQQHPRPANNRSKLREAADLARQLANLLDGIADHHDA